MVITDLNLRNFCLDCDKYYTDIKSDWCIECISKLFQQDFSNWTSRNEFIDKFIQETQLNTQNQDQVLEWIPYNKLLNIEKYFEGRFSTIYKAIWPGDPIREWSNIEEGWARHNNRAVEIRTIGNLSNLNEEILNKVWY